MQISRMSQEPNESTQHDHGLAVQEARPEIAKPPMFRVMMLNDDYTPMEFVVVVLERFFGMSREVAVRVMYHVHTDGSAVCGLFTREVAETKVNQVNNYARAHQHPLVTQMEAVD